MLRTILGRIGRDSWKCYGVSSFRCIILRHFFSTSAAAAITKPPTSSSPVSLSSISKYLVKSLGLSEQEALSTSTKLTNCRRKRGVSKVIGFNFYRNADTVIKFLLQKGLDKPQIRNVVLSAPQLLTSRVKLNIEPKMKTFEDMGISASQFADFLSTSPAILRYGLHSTIRPALDALISIMGSNDNLIRVIKGFRLDRWGSITKHLVCNVSLLQDHGIPIESIQKRILQQSSPYMRKPEAFKGVLIWAEEKWGISPRSSMFLHAIQSLGCSNEKNMESKCRVFESFGWDRSDVVNLFRGNPYCLATSEAMIKKRLIFFMNELGYDPNYIAKHPTLMLHSLEKRVWPRHGVLQLLKEKGLIKENLSLCTALKMTESQFLARFVEPFRDNVPNLFDMYSSSIGSSSKKQNECGKKTSFSRAKVKPDSSGL